MITVNKNYLVRLKDVINDLKKDGYDIDIMPKYNGSKYHVSLWVDNKIIEKPYIKELLKLKK